MKKGYLVLPSILFFLQCKEMPMNIVPIPQEWHWQKGNFLLSSLKVIRHNPSAQHSAETLQSMFQEQGGPVCALQCETNFSISPHGIYVWLADQDSVLRQWLKQRRMDFTPVMAAEGYVLIVEPEVLLIAAPSTAGLFYGIQSLKSLGSAASVPCLRLRDWPDFSMRGISDDLARGQISTMDNFKAIIRFLAAHKMNTYMPYLEDLLACKSFPVIGEHRGRLTPEDFQELQAYAERHYVQIIPIFQTLGHMENILLHNEFIHLAEYPGAASLNVNSDSSYVFLKKYLDEAAPVFRAPYFHIGGDESYDVGRWASRDRVQKNGLGRVHLDHYQKILQLLTPHHKTAILYGDMLLRHPDILADLPKEVVVMDWNYDAKRTFPSLRVWAKAGQPFIVSPGIHNWRRIFPEYQTACKNIERFTLQGRRAGARGMIVAQWNDFGALSLRELCYYGYAFAAECAWKGGPKNRKRFERKFFSQFYSCNDDRIAEVYHALEKMSRRISWVQFFSHPFYPLDDNGRGRIQAALPLLREGLRLRKTLAAVQAEGQVEPARWTLLELCNDLFLWYGRLAQVQKKMSRQADQAEAISRELLDLAVNLRSLAKTYQQVWRQTNREENLQLVVALFERLAASLEIKSAELMQNDWSFNGRMPAPFITHPDTVNGRAEVFLRCRFRMQQSAPWAQLQLIADSDAQVWLNGVAVGRVFARRSGSAWVQSERVKAWPVDQLLQAGENNLLVQVQNYHPHGIAAANVWLEWKDHVLHSGDESWQASLDQRGWTRAMGVVKDWTISRPYFANGLISRIEFY